jgi:membrane-anchored glycerophosphoryl diester phosphodiesterase (GDPDase)
MKKGIAKLLLSLLIAALVILLLIYLYYLLDGQISELKQMVEMVKTYFKNNLVDPFPPLP